MTLYANHVNELMRPIIHAGRCPISSWANRTIITEYSKNVVRNETIFVCQVGLERMPQENMNASCKNRGSRTENNTACSNSSEGILLSYYFM